MLHSAAVKHWSIMCTQDRYNLLKSLGLTELHVGFNNAVGCSHRLHQHVQMSLHNAAQVQESSRIEFRVKWTIVLHSTHAMHCFQA